MIGSMGRNRITIQSVTNTSDSQGGYTTAWTDLCTVHANLQPLSASQVFHTQQLEHRVTHKFIIRRRTDITSDMRIYFDSEYYYIKSIRDLDSRKRYSELMAEKGVGVAS